MCLCLLLVSLNYKYGSRISIGLVTFSIIAIISKVIRFRSLTPIPGLITSIIMLFVIYIVYSFYKKIWKNSFIDYLTGFKNRRKFGEDIEAKIHDKDPFWLACIEIEGFKQINDIYGLQAGDHILKELAKNLKASIGKKDSLYRVTGANFYCILDGASRPETVLKEIMEIEHRLIVIPDSVLVKDSAYKSCKFSISVGLASFPDDAMDSITLLKFSDVALAYAKKKEGNKVSFFNKSMESEEIKQKEAELLINEAIEKNYFYLVYQPQYTIADKKLRGFETLIRCRKPDGSIISPAVFIPAAEKSNLIFKIDDYVLRRAMTEFKDVVKNSCQNLTISVNVSAKNMARMNFADNVKNILTETGFPANNLEIEITEYSLADSINTTIANIVELRDFGVQIALDDFGTGYTSIAQLLKLPINLLKIDKSLIDDIEVNQMNRDLVDSVIYMGHVMNCEVISEGVETERQLALLNEHKCDFVQGFVWGKPLEYQDAVQLCKS